MGQEVRAVNLARAETRACITKALVKLTQEKALSSISVTELCQAAGVSRMAFYRNYDSKEEVFTARLEEVIADYARVTEPLLKAGTLWYDVGHLSTCFEFFKNNAALMNCLFRCGFTGLLVKSISDFLIGRYGNGTPGGNYILTAFAGSLCACYPLWAKRGFKESPRQMAELLGSSSEPSQFRESCGFRKVSHEQLELAIRPASLIAFQSLGLRSSLPFVLNNLRLSVTLCIAEQKTALSNVTICNR